ncbi:MAG TPA: sulfite exporter TauE/SafE family protein [Armatimonadota bacterium]|nr:sulfite exporter TauE/SafE family protein [Armatimonadota bacterium]
MSFDSLIPFFAAIAAGTVNSVAGGGTLLTFPALMATGQAALIANATSTVALFPGSASSSWGYRSEITGSRHVLVPLMLLGVAGGVLGSYLLLVTPAKAFDHIVPFLVLGATLLFVAQEPLSRWLRARSGADKPEHPAAGDVTTLRLTPALVAGAFLTAVYGGYFGAGIGIVTLAMLSFMGLRNIHQMNGVKNVYALSTNAVAAAIFITKGLVDWRLALFMAAGSVFGGYAGAGIARKIGQKNVRRIVIGIGFVLTASLLLRH